MRLWSLHPKYLDSRGLVAFWREGLLAQAVLRGQTRGYTHHPQLIRFQQCSAPVSTIASYLGTVQREATRRGYAFDRTKLARANAARTLTVTKGQLEFEWEHLVAKVALRDPAWHRTLQRGRVPAAHPDLRVIAGGVENWERAADASRRSL